MSETNLDIDPKDIPAMEAVYLPALMGDERSSEQIATWQEVVSIRKKRADRTADTLFSFVGYGEYADKAAVAAYGLSDAMIAAHLGGFSLWNGSPPDSHSFGDSAEAGTRVIARAIDPAKSFELTTDQETLQRNGPSIKLAGKIAAEKVVDFIHAHDLRFLGESDWEIAAHQQFNSDQNFRVVFNPLEHRLPSFALEASTKPDTTGKLGRVCVESGTDSMQPDLSLQAMIDATMAMTRGVTDLLTYPGVAVLSREFAL